MMDIYAEQGHKVKFINENGHDYEREEEIIVKRAYNIGFKAPGFSGSDVVIIAIKENADNDEITEVIKQKLSKRYNKRSIEVSGFRHLSLDKVRFKDISLEDFAMLFDLTDKLK